MANIQYVDCNKCGLVDICRYSQSNLALVKLLSEWVGQFEDGLPWVGPIMLMCQYARPPENVQQSNLSQGVQQPVRAFDPRMSANQLLSYDQTSTAATPPATGGTQS